VYREGVDSGSMFRKNFPTEVTPSIKYPIINDGKIHVFAGQSRLPNGLIDETGTVWRLSKDIPAENIYPSAKNRIGNINLQKNEFITPKLKNFDINSIYITTRKTNLSPYKITCRININSITTILGAVNIPNGTISETSSNLITEKIFIF